MNVWHLVFRTDSLTYTIAKALSYGGHDVFVWVVDSEQDHRFAEGIQKRLRDTPRVRIVARDDARLPSEIDRLIVQVFPRPTQSIQHVKPLAQRARRITLITAGDRSRSWQGALKLQGLEARGIGVHFRKIDRILYKDGFYPRDLLGLFKSRSAVGFDVHSQFLHDDELYRAMHARDWDPQARRSIRANFLGSRDPAVRERALAGVRPFFHSQTAGPLPAATGKSMYWHEYSDADPIGVPPQEFVNVLTQSDFTLCPRGYSLVTHRPMEALLRGSIPVLAADEADLYGIQLEDGVNCISVPAAGWPEAMQRLTSMEESKIVHMRTGVLAMFEEDLSYRAVAAGIRRRLGLEN